MANQIPLPLPSSPPRGFLPLRRPCGPPFSFPLRRTCRPFFPAGWRPSPFPLFPPHGILLRLLWPHPWRWLLRWRLRRPLRPLNSFPAPIPSYSPAVAVSSLPASPAAPAVSASSSDVNSSVSSPRYLALSSVLSFVLISSARYFPPAPVSLLRAGRSSLVFLFPPASVAVPAVSSVLSCSSPSAPRVVSCLSLYLPLAPLPPPLLSRGLLHPPAPPLMPPP